jgi:hypothetical protein
VHILVIYRTVWKGGQPISNLTKNLTISYDKYRTLAGFEKDPVFQLSRVTDTSTFDFYSPCGQ